MKRALLVILMAVGAQAEMVKYTMPLMGTQNTKEVSCGNLYPAIAAPWGMNFWTPQTDKVGQGWLYDYTQKKIMGFHQTHQPSPWIGDYGQFSVMPTVGKRVFNEGERASWFSHKAESALAHYYRVYLADYDTTVELTPTERAAYFRVRYPETDSARFVVDALDSGSHVRVDVAARRVYGWSSKMNVRGNELHIKREPLKTFFVLEFDRPIVGADVWRDKEFVPDVKEATCGHAGVAVSFAPMKRGELLHVKVASSFIDEAQAVRNLREVEGSFEEVLAANRKRWNDVLGRLKVEGGSDEQKRVFYTCLYRSLLFPRQLHEVGADGKLWHRSPYGKGVLPGPYYCDTGFWDTFRALFPLLNLLYPEVNSAIMTGLAACYEESGWIPEWSAPFHRNCMIGQNSASVIADSLLAGNCSIEDAKRLYPGLLHSANTNDTEISSLGRAGFSEYNTLGWVSRDGVLATAKNSSQRGSSAARTLEYAYADWCIAKISEVLGRPKEETALYYKRSENWRNLLHPQYKIMCGRNLDGSFDKGFNEIKWGYDFTEGTPLHYNWSVFHNIPGLVEAMGGKERFEAELDRVFAMSTAFDGSFFGGCTHEIREMQITDFGQYAHGNQPIQHMIYLFDYVGAQRKTQHWAREVMNRLYRPWPDGYCGDEDNGQTSAWFVWSAMGFYPVCPASGEYAIGAPLFEGVTVSLPGGKTLVIKAPGNSDERRYSSKVLLNGKAMERSFISMRDFKRGGEMVFEMGL